MVTKFLSILRSIFYLGLLVKFAAGSGLGAGLIELPFDARWSDPPGKLVDWGSKRGYEVNIQLPAGKPEERRVMVTAPSGNTLPQSFAHQVEAIYHQGRLVEISLTQRDPALSAATVKANFLAEKRRLSGLHGSFKTNRRASATRSNFSTDSLSYHVEPLPGLFILLLHTEMEDQLRQVREGRFTLVYRNENLKEQLEKENT